MQETALPSSTRPSDHVLLVSTFKFRDAPAYLAAMAYRGDEFPGR